MKSKCSAAVSAEVLAAVFFVLFPLSAPAADWYVDDTGSDANDCMTAGTACMTAA